MAIDFARTNQRRRRRWLQVLGCIALLLALLLESRESAARLDPFYIVNHHSQGRVVPRVLFVLDTSGSMGFEQPWPDTKCTWSACESDGLGQSRVHAARDVINEVVEHAGESAQFGLMTFGMVRPPQSSQDLPDECYSYSDRKYVRFTWVTHVNQPWGNVWKPLTNIFGQTGTWLLCGDNRPFPYLRHDDLGGFALPDDSQEPLSDEPLYLTKSSWNKFKNKANYDRKVQFFPRFIGRRANLDCSDDKQLSIVDGSFGDWGTSKNTKRNNICERDFYYWPYVDGNPGYSYYSGYSPDSMWHRECDDDGGCWSTTSSSHRLGVTRRHYDDGATLYVPFYSQAVIDTPEVPDDAKGPLDSDDAAVMFDGLTSDNHLGGIDVSGGTPWRVAIGNVDWQVANGVNGLVPKPATPMSNAAFSHTTVASYLSFLTTVGDADVCRPTIAILVTDGQPDPWETQGGSELYSRLAKLRKRLGVRVYLIGFGQGAWNDPVAWERMHHMACAAAGANSSNAPCDGSNDYDWDTCRDPSDPQDGCAWLADDSAELADALKSIIDGVIAIELPAGPPTVATAFQASDPNDPNAKSAVQTTLEAWTETPSWRGHVRRAGCTDEVSPGVLAEHCAAAEQLPLDGDEQESFGPCPRGRVWDAGECLQQTPWTERRIYTHDLDNQLIRVASNGVATTAFREIVLALDAQGQLDPPLTQGQETQEIKAMVELLYGRRGPGGWKLPGIANSAPVLITRVPRPDDQRSPSVGIRDPHCAGRRNTVGEDIPSSLEDFAADAWQLDQGQGLAPHYDYAEAVLVGDDFGLVHGFHHDSGNELFAFLPLALINNARVLSLGDPNQFGQAGGVSDHVYGVAATVNAGWAWDEAAETWRHLAVFGLGPGGAEIVTVDVSHMGRVHDDDPLEVLWTSSTSELAPDFAATLGQTWSRPALTYAVPNEQMSVEPRAFLVFGSGYRDGSGAVQRGRVTWMVDAMTGAKVTAKAYAAPPQIGSTYDTLDDVTNVGDVAVASHCLSRFWGEMQEAYWADAAGRLYRWDLAANAGVTTTFPHAADGGGTWPTVNGYAAATPSLRMPACRGQDDFACSVSPIGLGGKGDVFTYAPAVTANHRIDDIDDPGDVLPLAKRDQFLLALISGSPHDAAIDGNDFHSSLYLLVDDHRQDPAAGFDVPAHAPTTPPGSHAKFMRLPLSQIERTRHVEFPDGSSDDQTRVFSKRARPIRAPMMFVTGVADGTEQVDASVYYVSYLVYEPGDDLCDPRWYDEDAGEWIHDGGTSYEITFRLALGDDEPFDLQSSYVLPGDPGDGFGVAGALSGPVVRQLDSCPNGNCGPIIAAPKISPCDPNDGTPAVAGAISIPTHVAELDGFTPLELP